MNEKEDLVLQAVKAFPVWEEGCIAICFDCDGNPFKECNENNLRYIVTREQHALKLAELFEDAPEDATHVTPESEHYYLSWWKKEDGKMFVICEVTGEINWTLRPNFNENRELIPRPKPKPITGDTPEQLKEGVEPQLKNGLPPVGTECEYFDRNQKVWEPALIVAHHMNGMEAIWCNSVEGGSLYYGTDIDFRPLKTERDIFIERSLDGSSFPWDIEDLRQFIGSIYDKGARFSDANKHKKGK